MQHIILDRSRLSDLDCFKGPSMIIQFPKILSLLGVIEQSDLISLTVHKRARKAIKSCEGAHYDAPLRGASQFSEN